MPESTGSPVKVRKLHESAQLPVRGSANAAGADLCCIEGFTLAPGERKAIATGLAVEIQPGWYGRVAPRSGLAARHGLDTLAGVVDADYRGELLVLLVNLGAAPVSLNAGERIAQFIIERVAQCEYEWTEDLSNTARGAGGFGSTGR